VRPAYGDAVSGAALDRLLAFLLVVQLTTGLLTLRSGQPASAPLFWVHGLVAGALLVASVEKLRRSVGPAVRAGRWRNLLLGALLALLVAAALAGGFAWVASGRIWSIGPWTILTLHVWAALAILPILVFHLLPRRWRLLRPRSMARPMARRTFLAVAGVTALGAVAWGAANILDRLRGGERRFTGSRWLPEGGVPPPTTFYGEGTPAVDPDRWRLLVRGRVSAPLELDLPRLASLGTEDRSAVLDCTSGWVLRTTWRGTPLAAVLAAAGADPHATFVKIRSVTGWMVPLERHEIRDALLATHVAGRSLPAGNGAPVRLVAPGRRGLDWVKWVTEIEVA
jgi:DMSO/TMAO reductase YedYZ molybdopterin-dependent catalytic subunit